MRQIDLQFKEKYNSDWYLDYEVDYYIKEFRRKIKR